MTERALGALAGVYTISFLIVMIYFGIGNFLLKIKRDCLPRPVVASPLVVTIAVAAVLIAPYGNIKLHPDYLFVFLQYFVPAVIAIMLMMNRIELLKMALIVLKNIFDTVSEVERTARIKILQGLKQLHDQQFVYFSKGDSISSRNKVMMYVQENEVTHRLKIVTILKDDQPMPAKILSDLEVLDRAYPEIDIEFIQLTGTFSPELIKKISDEWRIPINFMFIASPGDKFPYKISELEGVRLII